MTIAIGEPERAAVADPAEELQLVLLEAHARTAPVAEAPARELGRDVVSEDGKAGGHALDRDHEGRTVGFARRQVAQHGVLRSDVGWTTPTIVRQGPVANAAPKPTGSTVRRHRSSGTTA